MDAREQGLQRTGLSYVGVIGAAIVIISLLHFSVGTHTHTLHIYHVIFRSLYVLPIVAAAIWFRWKGALLAGVVVCAAYATHIWVAWKDQPMENANQVAMIAMYLVVAFVTGGLSSLEARQRSKRRELEQRMQREIIVNSFEGLSRALRWRDASTQRHSEIVSNLSVMIARDLSLCNEDVERLRLAARMHDIGKIGIADDILLKPGKLTEEERKVIDQHPIVAADILRPIAGTAELADIVIAHHESPDGSGYPYGLSGQEIPRLAHILRVADVYSALTEDRPYHAGMNSDRAIAIMEDMRGAKLDAAAFDSLRRIVSGRGAG